jgi:hypothetical protein
LGQNSRKFQSETAFYNDRDGSHALPSINILYMIFGVLYWVKPS